MLRKMIKRVTRIVPDKIYLKLKFFLTIGRKLNLSNPSTYNEKIQWLKLYDRKKEYAVYVDKYAVREYIAKTIGEEYLIPLIGVYDKVEDIPWDELPQKFILKCTHGSQCNIICKNKSNLNIRKSNNDLKKWMNQNWFFYGREWPYKQVTPRIICEELIEDKNGKLPKDYKIMCFNGEPHFIQVHSDRFENSYTNDFYSIKWEKTKICQGVPNSKKVLERPSKLEEMIKIAKILSKDIPYVRIDFYEQNGQVFFGEITLYPTSGFTPFIDYNDDVRLGKMIQIN